MTSLKERKLSYVTEDRKLKTKGLSSFSGFGSHDRGRGVGERSVSDLDSPSKSPRFCDWPRDNTYFLRP